MTGKNENELSRFILDAAFGVHSSLGPGLLESAYEACLAYELRESGLTVRSQVAVPLIYKSVKLDVGYRLDLLVEELVVIEIKSGRCIDSDPSGATALTPETQRQETGTAHQFSCCPPEAWNKTSSERPLIVARNGRSGFTMLQLSFPLRPLR